jgi:hypothetical protein
VGLVRSLERYIERFKLSFSTVLGRKSGGGRRLERESETKREREVERDIRERMKPIERGRERESTQWMVKEPPRQEGRTRGGGATGRW